MIASLQPTLADTEIQDCVLNRRSFSVVAGAGSGKTTSLVSALNFLRADCGEKLRRNNQRIVCITYTKRATAVIEERLGFDDLYLVSTIHSFLWTAVSRFTNDIRTALRDHIIPAKIAKYREKDKGGKSIAATKARDKANALEAEIELLTDVSRFKCDESQFSNFSKGQIGHDNVIILAAHLISTKPILQ